MRIMAMPHHMTVDEIHNLAKSILMKHGCSAGHADAVAETVSAAAMATGNAPDVRGETRC